MQSRFVNQIHTQKPTPVTVHNCISHNESGNSGSRKLFYRLPVSQDRYWVQDLGYWPIVSRCGTKLP